MSHIGKKACHIFLSRCFYDFWEIFLFVSYFYFEMCRFSHKPAHFSKNTIVMVLNYVHDTTNYTT